MTPEVLLQQGVRPEFRGLLSNLQRATHGMLEFVWLMKSSYTDLPTSREAIGEPKSAIITELRARMTDSLLLYKLHHLPLGLETISNLEDTLQKYFLEDSLERFKTLLPLLRRRLTSSITRANDVRDEYVRLASELKKAVSDGETELRIVKLVLDQKRENASMSKEAAENLKKVGPASVMGGAFLAASIIGSGGIVFPALGPAVAAVAFASAGMSAAFNEMEGEFLVVCSKLEQGLDGLQEINKHAISTFAECMSATANFFNTVATKLDHLPPRDASAEDPDEILKIVHEDMKRDARALITACESFRACCTKMQVDIQVLSAFQTENTRSYVDRWIRNNRREEERQNNLRIYEEVAGYCSRVETPVLGCPRQQTKTEKLTIKSCITTCTSGTSLPK